MLSRTADSLYWLSRYTERADLVARILDATIRLASLPSGYGGERNEWESAVAVAADLDAFKQHYDVVNEDTVRHFLAFNMQNPSSIRNCIETARDNARASLRNRPRAAGSRLPVASTFNATSRSRRSSRARYTTPIAPEPMRSTTM